MHLFLSVVVVVTTTPRCRRDLYAFPTDFAPPSTTKTAPGRARLLRPTPENRKRKNRLSRGKRNFQKLQKECSHPRRRSFRPDSKPRWWGGAQESRRKRVATARTGFDGAKDYTLAPTPAPSNVAGTIKNLRFVRFRPADVQR